MATCDMDINDNDTQHMQDTIIIQIMSIILNLNNNIVEALSANFNKNNDNIMTIISLVVEGEGDDYEIEGVNNV